jgi:Bacterial Ig-like domain (group 2)
MPAPGRDGVVEYSGSPQTTVMQAIGLTIGRSLMLAVLLSGCRGGTQEPDPAVAEVDVEAPATTVQARNSMQLKAIARDSERNVLEGRSFAWAAGDTAIATVSRTGLVTARAPGQVEIRASAGGVTGRLGINVLAAPPRTINVTTVAGFRSALNSVLPGDSILLGPGTYTLTSPLSITRSGTANQPITVQGDGWGNTVIDVNTTALTFDSQPHPRPQAPAHKVWPGWSANSRWPLQPSPQHRDRPHQ